MLSSCAGVEGLSTQSQSHSCPQVCADSKALERSAEVREVSRGDEDVLVLLLVLLLELLCCEDHIETLLTFLNSQTRS